MCYYQVYIIGESVCSHNQLSTRLACTAQVASVIQPYIESTVGATHPGLPRRRPAPQHLCGIVQ